MLGSDVLIRMLVWPIELKQISKKRNTKAMLTLNFSDSDDDFNEEYKLRMDKKKK